MPIEIAASFDKNGRKHIIGEVFPGNHVFVGDYSSGRKKNLAVHVAGDESSATIYEFPYRTHANIGWPHERRLPFKSYAAKHRGVVLKPGESFNHPLTTRSHVKGKVQFTYLPSHRGPRTSLAGRHK